MEVKVSFLILVPSLFPFLNFSDTGTGTSHSDTILLAFQDELSTIHRLFRGPLDY